MSGGSQSENQQIECLVELQQLLEMSSLSGFEHGGNREGREGNREREKAGGKGDMKG